MTPVQIVPENERDPDKVIRDAKQAMDDALATYQAAVERWVQACEANGITPATVKRWT